MGNAGQRRARWRAQAIAMAACAWAVLATPVQGATTPAAASSPQRAKAEEPVDVNSASRAQLKALPGIGDAEADRIVKGRPYRSKADLVEYGVIPQGTYQSIKGRIIAKQKATPGGKRS